MKHFSKRTKDFVVNDKYDTDDDTQPKSDQEDDDEVEDINCPYPKNQHVERLCQVVDSKGQIKKIKETLYNAKMINYDLNPSLLNKKRKRSTDSGDSTYKTEMKKSHVSIPSSASLDEINQGDINDVKVCIENNHYPKLQDIKSSMKLLSDMELFMEKNFPEAYDPNLDSHYHNPRKFNLPSNHVDFGILRKEAYEVSLAKKDKGIIKMTIPQLPKLKWSPLPNEDYSPFLHDMKLNWENFCFMKYSDEYVLEYLMINYYNRQKCLNEIGHCVQFTLSEQQQEYQNESKYFLRKDTKKGKKYY